MTSLRSLHITRGPLRAVAAISALAALSAGAAPALAETTAAWKLEARAAPTNLPLKAEGVKGEGVILVTATDMGDAEVNAVEKPVTITDTLPAQLKVLEVQEVHRGTPKTELLPPGVCSAPSVSPITCTFKGNVGPYEQYEMLIKVKSEYTAPAEPETEVSVTGGGVPLTPPLHQQLKVSASTTSFGVESFALTPENEKFEPEEQAGSHPFQLTTTFNLNEAYELDSEDKPFPSAPDFQAALQRNLSFKLPAGLIGNANVVGNPNAPQQCPDASFDSQEVNGLNACPENTAIGVASVSFNDPITLHFDTKLLPVFNLVPAPGEPARFGFDVVGVPIILDTSVRTGEDYGVTVSVRNASQAVQVLGSRVTIWGAPLDPRHQSARGWQCLGDESYVIGPPRRGKCEPLNLPGTPAPFLMLPTQCTEPLTTAVEGDAWNGLKLGEAGESLTSTIPPLKGCGQLPFNPSLEVQPDQEAASTPTGMTVKVNMPQQTTLEDEGKAEADIKETTLELPEGLQASAGAADGLQACGVAETGFIGGDGDTGATLTGELEAQRFTPAAAMCPNASKMGTVDIKTPLLEKDVTGAVYLGDQDTNPFASPLVLYIVAEEEKSKVLVKLAGEVEINPTTGQLTSKFKNTPQTPFSSLTLHLFNGERASEATPAYCGSYHATATFTTWSGGVQPPTESSPAFQITSGPNGTPCPGATLPFEPALQAGSTNPQGGAFSPFSLTINRPDGDQAMTGLSMLLPKGAAAMLSNVTPCPEPPVGQEWTCGAESEIGHSTASSGLGGDPFTLGGTVYLTTGYDGAPFGVLDRTLAAAGPFNLGYVNVRSRINVNRETAQATITIDPGPRNEGLPTILKGVPVQLKQVNVSVDRPNFDFNPTNCTQQSVTATLSGAQGTNAAVSSPFNVSNCAALPFTPTLTASASGHGSKADGTAFTVKVTSSPGQANIGKTFLTIPAALPSRLTTIQQACPDSVFEANPATCDEGSNIGYAVAHTPVLKKPFEGPAYLVSHGNAAFPDVEFVLQSEGITVVLDGKTNIKAGVTYSRFESVPDAPVTTFETVLPAGPHSALTANVPESENFSLCKTPVAMPTEIVGQNGAIIKQTTKVAITGCKGVLGTKYTRSQLLAKALKACKKDKKKSKRLACEKQARKKYGAKQAAKKSSKKAKKAKRK
jgi:hypothetical protein